MSKLRLQIISESVYRLGLDDVEDYRRAADLADAILALVADALLSDAAVEAAELRWASGSAGIPWQEEKRAELTAALDAAGITEDT